MFRVFHIIPAGFFNNLASGSNQRIYSDCLQLIYKEYEREISYRIPRIRIRDMLALYFLENQAKLSSEDYSGDQTANDMAGAVIRKFPSKDVGWLEEEIDDTTYEKQIIMTENGIALAEFLNQLEKPEKEEFSSYIYNIYNTLNNTEQWEEIVLAKQVIKKEFDKRGIVTDVRIFAELVQSVKDLSWRKAMRLPAWI